MKSIWILCIFYSCWAFWLFIIFFWLFFFVILWFVQFCCKLTKICSNINNNSQGNKSQQQLRVLVPGITTKGRGKQICNAFVFFFCFCFVYVCFGAAFEQKPQDKKINEKQKPKTKKTKTGLSQLTHIHVYAYVYMCVVYTDMDMGTVIYTDRQTPLQIHRCTHIHTYIHLHRHKQARHNLIKVVAVVVLILSGCQWAQPSSELESHSHSHSELSSIIEPFDFFPTTTTNLLPKWQKNKKEINIYKKKKIYTIYNKNISLPLAASRNLYARDNLKALFLSFFLSFSIHFN